MKKPRHFLHGLGVLVALAGLLLLGSQLYAQQQTDQQAPSQAPAQQPSTSAPQAQPDQGAAASAGDSQSAGEQVFTGTVSKSGSKYVLQGADGKTYDLDHQELLAEHQGRQVRIKGMLDPDGKTIHIK